MIVILTVGDLLDDAKDLPVQDVKAEHAAEQSVILEADVVYYSKGERAQVLKDDFALLGHSMLLSELWQELENKL